jgi:hypothetical protein
MQRTTSDLSDLAKALVSLSSAASIFGVNQFGRLLDVRDVPSSSDQVARRLDSVTRVVTAQLEGRLPATFARADLLQRRLVDLMAEVVTLDPSGFLASSSPILAPLVSAIDPLVTAFDRAFPGTDAEVRWTELRNKLEIYFLVENAGSRLGISPVENAPLTDLVERAYALGAFLSLWAVEGLGHVYGAQALEDTSSPRGLLTGPEADAVRPGSLLMLHAGIGLAFAEALLQPVTPESADASLREVVPKFAELCGENSRPGYVGAAYESLGLVTRTFHPDLVASVDRELQRSAEHLVGSFWHGVGRAIYFSARSFVPCAEIDWAGAPAAAPHEIGRLNITAGLAWAVTLVNMRQPIVMDRMLGRHGDVLASTPAFANGVESSIVMRCETTPDADFIGGFCSYVPRPVTGSDALIWSQLIAGPCRQAIFSDRPALERAGRLDSVFRYRPPNDWPRDHKERKKG